MSDVTRSGRELAERFQGVGHMSGKTLTEISAVVGHPNSISEIGDGLLAQWIETGCHVAINFDQEGKFVNISHQFSNFEPEPSMAAKVVGIIVVLIIVAWALLVR